MPAHSFLIESSSKFLVNRTGIKARTSSVSGLWFPWPIYIYFFKWEDVKFGLWMIKRSVSFCFSIPVWLDKSDVAAHNSPRPFGFHFVFPFVRSSVRMFVRSLLYVALVEFTSNFRLKILWVGISLQPLIRKHSYCGQIYVKCGLFSNQGKSVESK